MLRSLIRFALRQRLLIVGATLLVAAAGIRAFIDLPVEAFPDVEDVRVEVISIWKGHAAEEIEKLVTLPVERQMNGLPGLTNLRSISMFGLSDVTMTFQDGTTDYFARQQVIERPAGTSTVPYPACSPGSPRSPIPRARSTATRSRARARCTR